MADKYEEGLYNQSLTNALLRNGIPTPGSIYYLDPTNGSNSNDGKSVNQAFAGLIYAEDHLTAGQHDVLVYLAGSTSLQLAESLTWDKDYTHFISMAAPSWVGCRARIMHNANFSPMITLSGNGCIFANLYFSYGRGGADNHILMASTGDHNYFKNVNFAGMLNDTEAQDASSVALQMVGSHNNLFEDCAFGVGSIARTAANTLVDFTTTASGQNYFKNCKFISWSTAATPTHIRIADGMVDRFIVLDDCLFVNEGTSLTQVIDDNQSAASTMRFVVIKGDTMIVGADDWGDATSAVNIWHKRQNDTANIWGLPANPAAS